MALLGFNGGLLGRERIPERANASGVWLQEEQCIARRAGIWPDGADPYFSDVLLLQSYENGIADSGLYGVSMSYAGQAQVNSQDSRFGGSSLSLPSDSYIWTSNTSLFNFGTGSFTVECWIKRNSSASNQTIYAKSSGSFGISVESSLYVSSSSSISFYYGVRGYSQTVRDFTTPTPMVIGNWHHIAFTRDGLGVMRCFVDGVQCTQTYADSVNLNGPLPFYIGAFVAGSLYSPFNGRIDEMRITAPGARYVANFTPPSNSFPVTGTTLDPFLSRVSLLLHMNGSNGSTVFTDSSSNALTVTANGNAQISTAQSKFSGASGYFDGNGDFLTVTESNSVLTFASGNFTIEFWLYPLDTSALQVFLDFRPSVQGAYPVIYVQSNVLAYYVNTGNRISASSALTANQWQHVAVVRSGTETKMYVNAVQVGSTYTDANSYAAPTCRIATSFDSYAANAYIDDLRITKGVARTITVPTSPFPDY